MKYLIHSELGPVIFSHNTDHIQLANYLGGKDKILSAGFVEDFGKPIGIQCFGESSTLNIPSDKKDTNIIKRELKIIEE